ncbi:glycosyltransferase family 2 protein [Segnochrobactrum spirostomi]|uniref:Glycosyltransferase n=1 Tax=Segnochrobactrum spirostomi TaxID=2608987 RepID=A0A6A7Y8E4_9HYPH|nr:glycosyltransferase family 2 protein [Segnochrobactrum spirostomi]MQT14261.1 glycosyltransferase [Segnochrobactrum spirostomi]
MNRLCRRIRTKLTQGGKTLRRLPGMVRHEGGLVRSAAKVARILRREGVAALIRRTEALARAMVVTPDGWAVFKDDYTTWLGLYEHPTTPEAASREIAAWAEPPRFAVVLWCSDDRAPAFEASLRAVRDQTYPHWQLVVAWVGEAANEADVAADPRITVLDGATPRIGDALNRALTRLGGDWLIALDPGDLLAPDALLALARSAVGNREAALLYSDEDVLGPDGRRTAPAFKPDWNPEFFLARGGLGQVAAYALSRVRSLGGFRPAFEGAHGFDLTLRFLEGLPSAAIVHVAEVLYHRLGPPIPQDTDLALAALREHLTRTGAAADAAADAQGGTRIRYSLPVPPPLVTILIPTRNGLALLTRCLASILEKTTYPAFEILVVDNGSDDPETLNYLRQMETDPRVRVVRDERPFDYAALNNAAARLARGSVLALVNNDIEVISPDWLDEMVSLAVRPETGAVGAALWYPDDRLQHGGIVLGIGGVAGHAFRFLRRGDRGYLGRAVLRQALSAVTAACLVVRKELYEAVGGLDETNLKIAYNDVDFCLRLRERGYRNVWTPYAELYHHESATRGLEDDPVKLTRFRAEFAYMQRRWGALLANDPAYNPNLTLEREDFSLAWPPRGRDRTDERS